MLCPKCGSYMDNGARVCPVCGARANANNPTAAAPRPQTPPSSTPDLPMNWFNFLIYFALWAGGIMNILISVPYFTGSLYDTGELSAALVYAALPQLKTMDMLYGIVLVACGAFVIYTRYRLAGFRADGPMCLYISYGASAGASLVYNFLIADLVGDLSVVTGAISSIAFAALMIVFNRTYFQRRAELFKN